MVSMAMETPRVRKIVSFYEEARRAPPTLLARSGDSSLLFTNQSLTERQAPETS
jgi:hypothetical protein